MVSLIATDVDVGCECGEEHGFPDLASAQRWARKHFDTCQGLGQTIGATATIALLPVNRADNEVSHG